MREIKFRAWDGEKYYNQVINIVFNHDTIQYVTVLKNGISVLLRGDNIVFEQYTGLKDKNGKEIYEGDIVNCDNGDKAVISWKENFASFCLNKKGWLFSHFFGEAFESNECLIIGNIHENPELLR